MNSSVITAILITFIAGFISAGFLLNQRILQQQSTSTPTPTIPLKPCTPTFRDGGGPYYKPNAPIRSQLAPDNHNGQALIVSGQILQNDCTTPASNVILDIWQADETGHYQDDWYRGRIKVGESGEYSFETVIPKGYGEGTGYRPPHIHFKVWQDDRELITSQMFYPTPNSQIDPAFTMSIESTSEETTTTHHNIIMP